MPIPTTYPGVYIEELPSGNQTITPAATSIAAFAGRAPFGPVDDALTCFNFGDFNRLYGGLSVNYPMSYAVQDFFNNGGSQAVIARLFESSPGEGSGYALLNFPPSPPLLPDNWLLDLPAAVGATSLALAAGPEGEPVIGMLVQLGSSPQQYTVTSFTAANPSKNTPAQISIYPALGGQPGGSYPACTALTFEYGSAPAGWSVLTTGTSLTIASGNGIPELGDTLTIGTDPTVYTITAMPAVKIVSGNMQIALTVSPKLAATVIPGASVAVSSPQSSPMPASWQMDPNSTVAGGKATDTLSVINGQNPPLPGDQFTVGSKGITYIVNGFTPATQKASAQIAFKRADGQVIVGGSSNFCACCTLDFTRPAPSNFAIKAGSKANGTSLTLSTNNGAATGVVDVGYTFQVQGDPNIYTIVIYNQATLTATFLPQAAMDQSSSSQITLSPPLQLQAASPGEWGNQLTASVDTNGITANSAAQFQQYDLEQDDLFNLSLIYRDPRGRTISSERYLNVATKTTGKASTFPNRLDRVLEANSSLASVNVMSMVPPGSGSASVGQGGNDGDYLSPETYIGDPDQLTGFYLLNNVPTINLLCVPPDYRLFADTLSSNLNLDPTVIQAAAEYCTNRRAIYIVDSPASWDTQVSQGKIAQIDPSTVGITGQSQDGIEYARNAAVYFPRVWAEDILLKGQLVTFPPCGMIAGAIAATDVARGVWKSPAGTAVGMAGVSSFTTSMTDAQNGVLNPLGINCLRKFPIIGPVIWGARTLMGADQLEDAYKYLSVRRLTLFIEDSLLQSTQWATFEPNTEALWSSLRLSVNSFLANLARQGAFYNYNVLCDATTTTPTDIANGVVNILVQIAPVYPAEFVMIQIQQTTAATSAS